MMTRGTSSGRYEHCADSFIISLLAGLGTDLGGLIAVIRRPGRRSFGFLMGMTASVMITLSFLELVNEAWKLLGYLTATIGFAAGAILMLVIDVLTPICGLERLSPNNTEDALAAALFLKSFHFLVPGVLAFAGGVMMFITLDELNPTAREHGHQHTTAVGIILGAIFIFLLSGWYGV